MSTSIKMTRALTLFLLSFVGIVTALAQAPPKYAVDPSWPKTLPHNWTWGHVEGVAADTQNHIWVLNRRRSTPVDDACMESGQCDACCTYAPEVVEFDQKGNVLRYWGG